MTSSNDTGSRDPAAAIAIVGAGPRGTSILERIGAHLGDADDTASARRLDVHVIDDAPDGAGRIWRTDQPRDLCMNTLAHAVTLFTEPDSTVLGPIHPGPTLYEWCVLARGDTPARADVPAPHVQAFDAFPVRPGLAADYAEELATLRPDSHPSRALYGEYLTWCYERAVSLLPPGVRVIRHRARAVGIERIAPGRIPGAGPHEQVELSTGGTLDVQSIVLATGWMPRAETDAETEFDAALQERTDLTWVRPESPVHQDLSGIAAGSHAIIRGLGMGFFDTVALLTIGRGGRFVEDQDSRSGLRYEASGREPVLHATSHRGVPFRAKSLYGSLPPRPEQRFMRAVDWAAVPRPIDFNHLLWPRIVADAFLDHAETLIRANPGAVSGTGSDVHRAIERALSETLEATLALGAGDAAESLHEDSTNLLRAAALRIGDAVAPLIPDPENRFPLLDELRPVSTNFASPEAFSTWVTARVAEDLDEAARGRESPLKAGLWSVSAARGLVSRIGTVGGIDAESRRTGMATLFAVGGMAGSGPPAFRNRQLLALTEAGLVRFIGPRARVEITAEGWRAESPDVAGSAVTASGLIDAWMHFHNLADTADPLARTLLHDGRARPFRIPSRAGGDSPTGSFDIDAETGRLIGAGGTLDPSVHVAGIPVDEQLHDTIISPMPGTDPPMLRETDRVARSALRVALGASREPALGRSPDTPPRAPTPITAAPLTPTIHGASHD